MYFYYILKTFFFSLKKEICLAMLELEYLSLEKINHFEEEESRLVKSGTERLRNRVGTGRCQLDNKPVDIFLK